MTCVDLCVTSGRGCRRRARRLAYVNPGIEVAAMSRRKAEQYVVSWTLTGQFQGWILCSQGIRLHHVGWMTNDQFANRRRHDSRI